MAPASTSPPVKTQAMTVPAKFPLLGGVGDLDAAVSLRLHALFLPVPRLLLKALEVAGDGRIWLPVPISLLLISTTTSSKVSPLLFGLVAGLVLDILFVGAAKLIVRRPRPAYNAGDMYVAVAASSLPASDPTPFLSLVVWARVQPWFVPSDDLSSLLAARLAPATHSSELLSLFDDKLALPDPAWFSALLARRRRRPRAGTGHDSGRRAMDRALDPNESAATTGEPLLADLSAAAAAP